MDEVCLDKTLRLLWYTKALSKLTFTSVKSYERYETTLWIHRFAGGGLEAPLLGEASEEAFLFRFTLPEEPIKPKPSDDLDLWLDKGGEKPTLKSEITDESGETLLLEDFPEIPLAFEEFLNQSEVYKKLHDEWFRTKLVYNDLFLLYQKWGQNKEALELICGVGLLQWGKICRPIVTLEVELQFDVENREFTLIPSERAVSVAVEIDMLDENVRSLCKLSEHKDFIETIGTDICDRETIGQFLTKFVHCLSADGTYDNIDVFERTVSGTPRISFTPGLFLRKRSSSGFLRCVNEIENSVKTTGKVQKFLKEFSEISDGGERKRISDENDGGIQCRDVEIYFPKPSNEEQKKIVRKLEVSDCVVVQGPPGTGKSHTIANLICHLLAKGKRILVTAKTERALKVLQNLLPEEFRQLSLSIVGNDQEALDTLAANVTHLIRECEDYNPRHTKEKIKKTASKLYNLRQEEAVLSRKLSEGTEAETKGHHINEHYCGTPTDIVRAVQKDREQYGWLEDDLRVKDFWKFKQMFSNYAEDFRYFLSIDISGLPYCSDEFEIPEVSPKPIIPLLPEPMKQAAEPEPQKRQPLPKPAETEMLPTLPKKWSAGSCSEAFLYPVEDFPSPEEFCAWLDYKKPEYRENTEIKLSILKVILQKSLPTDRIWISDIADTLEMHLEKDFETRCENLETCVRLFEENFLSLQTLCVPTQTDFKDLLEAANYLEQYTAKKHGFDFGWFRPKAVKRRLYLLKSVTINGHKLEEAEDFRKFGILLELKRSICKFLEDFRQKTDGTYDEQLETLKHIRELLKLILELKTSEVVLFGFFEKKPLCDLLRYNLEEFEKWRDLEEKHETEISFFVKAFLTNFERSDALCSKMADACKKPNVALYESCYAEMCNINRKTENDREEKNREIELENQRARRDWEQKNREIEEENRRLEMEWRERNRKTEEKNQQIRREWKERNREIESKNQRNAQEVQEKNEAIKEKNEKLHLMRHLFNAKLKLEKERLESCRKCRAMLHVCFPKMLEWVEKNCDSVLCSERIENFQSACEWKQANHWLQTYLNKENLKTLQARLRQIEKEKSECLKNLGKNYAKDAFFKRLTGDHCQYMEAYAMAVQKIGKGTGKKAQKWKADARQHLEKCKEAVPAWIMPMDRVFDTVTFDTEESSKFDVVIVDEASQCGIEGIPLFSFADKIIVIGDDKQISPENVGIEQNSVERLQKEYLFDYEFFTSFHPDISLFDHAKLRFGSGITLREHFRCMPEIIRFSNDLCYADTPLIPLRQFDQNRLPPLQSVFVEDGFREGDGQRVINRPEAEAISDKIEEICRNPAYVGKSIGVVILQGSAQADLIYQLLLERVSAEVLKERKIVCGNPYHFQGDERDVILLSMVAASNERNGVLSKDTDKRRFNVAASRARDQMILFHSLRLEDCSPNDLRHRLIAFFEEKLESEISNLTQSDLEYHVLRDDRSLQNQPQPFESWFEADVALELLRKRLHVFSQYKVGFKRIDLVIESGNQRLAIECDGDYWHGAEQYEADMERQRQLERCGWEFFRIRQSEFYADKTACLEPLWQLLRHRGMMQSILK